MSKKDIHIECYVRNAVSYPSVNGAYKLQERGHIHSKHTMFFKHEVKDIFLLRALPTLKSNFFHFGLFCA